MEWSQIIRDPHHDVCDAWEGQTYSYNDTTLCSASDNYMRIRISDKLAAALKKFCNAFLHLEYYFVLWQECGVQLQQKVVYSVPPPMSLVGLSKGDSSHTSEF